MLLPRARGETKSIDPFRQSAYLRRHGRCRLIFTVAICLWAIDCPAQSSKEKEQMLTLLAGTLPIILAAPHGGREPIPGVAPRRGIGVAQFVAERDSNTADWLKPSRLSSANDWALGRFWSSPVLNANLSTPTASRRRPMKCPKPNSTTMPTTERLAKRPRRSARSGAAACCSTFMPNGRRRTRFSAVPITAGVLANYRGNLAKPHC